jgi:DNA polymerase-3 subunit delta'
MAFADVLGHERVKRILLDCLAKNRVPHALLFAGPAGVGKRLLAMELARALLCEKRSTAGDCACRACARLARGGPSDLFVMTPEESKIRIEAVRDLTREIMSHPFDARARVFIIDDVHLMTEEASKALLKSLEEPPATSFIILVTPLPQALLSTIRSRCQLARFGPLSATLVTEHLVSQGVSREEAHLRASLSGGSLGSALQFDSDVFNEARERALRWLEGQAGASVLERMGLIEELADGDDPAFVLTLLRTLLRDIAALAEGLPAERLLNADQAARLAALAQTPLAGQAIPLLARVGEARDALRGSVNTLLLLDDLGETLLAR